MSHIFVSRTSCEPRCLAICQNFVLTFTSLTLNATFWLCLHRRAAGGKKTKESSSRHTDTGAGSVLRLAHSFISSLGVCEVWQPISARTPEEVLISSHRSCLCAVCSSAKECQVRSSCGPAQARYCHKQTHTHSLRQTEPPPSPAMRVTLG